MSTPEQRSDLYSQVTRFRVELQRRSASPHTDLDGHLPGHYLQAAQALLPLEAALTAGAPISADMLSSVFRGFYRANELVQLTEAELATFRTIERTARQLRADA